MFVEGNSMTRKSIFKIHKYRNSSAIGQKSFTPPLRPHIHNVYCHLFKIFNRNSVPAVVLKTEHWSPN